MQPLAQKEIWYWIRQEFPKKIRVREFFETEKQAVYKVKTMMQLTFPSQQKPIAKISESEYQTRAFFWRLMRGGVFYIQKGGNGRIIERIKVEVNGQKKFKQFVMTKNDVWDLVRTDFV